MKNIFRLINPLLSVRADFGANTLTATPPPHLKHYYIGSYATSAEET